MQKNISGIYQYDINRASGKSNYDMVYQFVSQYECQFSYHENVRI